MKKTTFLLSAVTVALSLVASLSHATSYNLRVTSPGVKGGPRWTACAEEKGICTFSGTLPVRYGANGKYETIAFTGPVACTNEMFGDPILDVVKSCSYDATATVAVAWTGCASEGDTCSFAGTRQVRYGAKGKYVTKTVTGSTPCTTAAFGTDPTELVVKACHYSTATR